MIWFLLRWLITSLTILMLPSLISGIEVRDFGAALATAAVLGVLNVLLKPILILLTLPLTILTLGLFLIIVNGLVFFFAGSLVSGITIASFGSALLASLVVSIVSWFTNSVGDRRVAFRYVRTPRTGSERASRTLDMSRDEDGKWR